MMKKIIYLLLSFIFGVNLFAQEYKVFHTSASYDLLCSIEQYENVLSHPAFANTLSADSIFISKIKHINQTVRASNLCNLYSSLPTSKNSLDSCIAFFDSIKRCDIPKEYEGKYVDNIFDVLPDIQFVLRRFVLDGYLSYWTDFVLPKLQKAIEGYKFEDGLLDKIHSELISMSGNNALSDEYAKIYILDIGNAFSLNDETFCCTHLLLDKELAKKYRINFIQVYIHENLHRIYLSKDLMGKLDYLYENNSFYRKNEDIAKSHGEGKNEAFIVAAESFISHKLGLKTQKEVLIEFREYVEGALVLSPIIYMYLHKKKENESFSDFLLSLFEDGYISSKKLKQQYDSAMKELES